MDPKNLEEALMDPKTRWDSLEESKARKCGIETRFERQSMLDKSVEESGGRTVEQKGA